MAESTERDPLSDTEQHDIEVQPSPEPDHELSDLHLGPLDNDDDARYLDPIDSRRRTIERQRGRQFTDDDEQEARS
jgi:hypothetical protein